ncbi:MAG: exosome protein [Thermoprotei archaeon]|nr:MAG: exosome protein [Thermoprotei archaeon]RLF01064.1 MAG: exosome protein [Thermoprotei archaeon]
MESNSCSKISIEAFCHATEDLRKVKQAVLNLIPSHLRSSVKISTENLRGYFGNPIVVVKAELSTPKQVDEVVKCISERLSDFDKELIKETLKLRLDSSGNLYLRLDKQKAYKGEVALAPFSDDIIKVKIQLPSGVKKLNKAREYLKNIGLI